ncbi:ROK family protein [Agromyces aerolatus]|uniref:ROK family protein n=1 Tax=Agromyces sp. LY-1074 TaxID=3074080 RepID=UPI00285B9ECE|nr:MULTISPECIES: ROK family protein [unclassified Agromyces]MDR5700484.1 ROK family protein [Agromyces sp. LY-1074]MDR5707005.1 ROK family protein [Agromyces sp. LY-1358]
MARTLLGAGSAVAAFDIGGTDLKAALFDELGEMLGIVREPTLPDPRDGVPEVVDQIATIWSRLAKAHPEVAVASLGVVSPGTVNEHAGVCVSAENLRWNDVPLRDQIAHRVPIPVAFGHDVRAAGLAEQRLGAAAAYRDCIVVVIGTGIAAAVFAGGQLYSADGYAGEIGHLVIDPAGPLCACGRRGCLEAIASAGAIARRYAAATGSSVPGAQVVLTRARAGDVVAQDVWNTAIEALGIGLSHVVDVLGPEAVIIGGGLSQAGDDLFIPLQAELDRRIGTQRRPLLMQAAIGQDAGLVGAALIARDLVSRSMTGQVA